MSDTNGKKLGRIMDGPRPLGVGSERRLDIRRGVSADELANFNLELLSHKERLAYWVCRLMVEADPILSTDAKLGVMTALNEMGYSRSRVQRMLTLGEPGKRASVLNSEHNSRETLVLDPVELAELADDSRKTLALEKSLPPESDPLWRLGKLGKDIIRLVQAYVDGTERS